MSQQSSTPTPSETCRGCGGTTSPRPCPTGCDGGASKRRGPVEALARELWNVAGMATGFETPWDEAEQFPSQREAAMAMARYVLRRYEGRNYA
jgi:hypothetical protein